MLVLSRKIGESVVITIPPCSTPQEIEVVVLEKNREGGSNMKVGFICENKDINILRKEVTDDPSRRY